MGIVHFMPLGTSPGAVTAPLAYLKHTYGERTNQWGRTVEEIVLFTTREIKEGRSKEHKVEYSCWNRYGSLMAEENINDRNVIEVVLKFIRKEIAQIMGKPRVYWCEASADDYKKSFRSASEALVLHLSKPETTGKNVWINLTGGTNIMNAALMQAALLSGLVSQVYYTFVPPKNTPYLQPLNDSFGLTRIPLTKSSFDEAYYLLLQEVSDGGWIRGEDLLSKLKRRSEKIFGPVTVGRFKREFLNKMDDGVIERERDRDGKKTQNIRITDEGREMISWIEDPIFQALTRRGRTGRDEIEGTPSTFGWEELPLEAKR